MGQVQICLFKMDHRVPTRHLLTRVLASDEDSGLDDLGFWEPSFPTPKQ